MRVVSARAKSAKTAIGLPYSHNPFFEQCPLEQSALWADIMERCISRNRVYDEEIGAYTDPDGVERDFSVFADIEGEGHDVVDY